MSGVRPFTRNDLVEVADLFAEVFFHNQPVDTDDLRVQFDTVYFDNPFYNEDCPSFVYCDQQGDIVGFLGVTPRKLRFRDEEIKTAIINHLMVKGGASVVAGNRPNHSNQLAPAALTKTLFRCPHDLCLADHAIDVSRIIWERSGGELIRLYSLRWTVILRPFSFGLNKLEQRSSTKPLIKLTKPIAALADGVIRPLMAWPQPRLSDDCTIDDVRPDDIIRELRQCRHYELVPDYTAEDLAWILDMAGSRKGQGPLRALMFHDKGGKQLGWAIYTAMRNGIGRLLQLYAHPKTISRVLDCLLIDAEKTGIVALSGKADPLFIDHLGKNNCFLKAGAWTLVRARRPELLQPFFTGKALFSDLESEGWTHFLDAAPG